jgi:hypothetical protein
MSRVRPAIWAAVGTLLVGAGVVLLFLGRPAGWLVILFFGAATFPAAAQATIPATLTLDGEGFTYVSKFPSSEITRRWSQCGPFFATKATIRVANQHSGDTIGRAGRPPSPSRGFAARSVAIPAGFDGLKAADLATLLNEYRTGALSAPNWAEPDSP